MGFKALFSKAFQRDANRDTPRAAIDLSQRENELCAAELDECVGGREEIDGVGCYLRATNTRMT